MRKGKVSIMKKEIIEVQEMIQKAPDESLALLTTREEEVMNAIMKFQTWEEVYFDLKVHDFPVGNYSQYVSRIVKKIQNPEQYQTMKIRGFHKFCQTYLPIYRENPYLLTENEKLVMEAIISSTSMKSVYRKLEQLGMTKEQVHGFKNNIKRKLSDPDRYFRRSATSIQEYQEICGPLFEKNGSCLTDRERTFVKTALTSQTWKEVFERLKEDYTKGSLCSYRSYTKNKLQGNVTEHQRRTPLKEQQKQLTSLFLENKDCLNQNELRVIEAFLTASDRTSFYQSLKPISEANVRSYLSLAKDKLKHPEEMRSHKKEVDEKKELAMSLKTIKEECFRLYQQYQSHLKNTERQTMEAIFSSESWEEVYEKLGTKKSPATIQIYKRSARRKLHALERKEQEEANEHAVPYYVSIFEQLEKEFNLESLHDIQLKQLRSLVYQTLLLNRVSLQEQGFLFVDVFFGFTRKRKTIEEIVEQYSVSKEDLCHFLWNVIVEVWNQNLDWYQVENRGLVKRWKRQ